jgi:hypothetical protein
MRSGFWALGARIKVQDKLLFRPQYSALGTQHSALLLRFASKDKVGIRNFLLYLEAETKRDIIYYAPNPDHR